jgi:hypothetical protein
MRVTVLSELSVVAVTCLCACCRSPDAGRTATSPDVLVYAAQETHARYARAVNAGKEVRSDVIPRRYWASAIRALKPIKVYTYRANIVVVQRICDHTEEGKCICTLITSLVPQDGVDGFSLRKSGNCVFDYQRSLDMIDPKGSQEL